MIIGIDANEANTTTRVGVGQYAYNVLKQLHRLDQKNSYFIYLKRSPLNDLPKIRKNWQYIIVSPQFLWTKLALPLKLFSQKQKLSLFFSFGHYSPSPCPCPTIPSILDLGYLKYPQQFTKKDFYQLKNWTQKSVKKARHLITISNFSKKEIQKVFNINPQKITIAPMGVGDIKKISTTKTKQILKKFNIKPPYFLALGTLKPNKNIPFLLHCFARFVKSHPNYQLVIAGKKGWLFQKIFETVTKLKLADSTIFTDFISETEKWILLKQTTALIIPSTYEGFGIPALEAMKLKTPVIASSIPVFKEILGSSAILISPKKPDHLVSAMNQITQPKTHRKYSRLGPAQAKRFTWEATAKIILALFDSLHQ